MQEPEFHFQERSIPENRSPFLPSLLLFVGLVAVGTVGYMFLTRSTALDALYMTVISITTVGYRETIDITNNPAARVFTILLLLSGAGVTVYVASNLTAFLVEGELRNLLWSRRMQKQISLLSDHIIVAGGGQTAYYAIQELIVAKLPFVVIEQHKTHFDQLIMNFPKARILGVIGDATDDSVLESAGVAKASGLISALPDDRDNLFVTITARGLNPTMRIIAKTVRQSSTSKMRMAGANEIVCPDSIGGLRMASQLIRPQVVSFLDTMIRIRADENIRIEEIRIQNPECLGRSIAELNLPNRYGNLLVLALKKAEHMEPVYNPKDTSLAADDVLIVMGTIDWIAKARAYLSI